jgi:hypothetical protein
MLLTALTFVSPLRASSRHFGFPLHQRKAAAKYSRNIAARVMASGEVLAPVAKRLKTNGSSWEHHVGDTYAVTGLQITDHTIRVPLDHTGEAAAAAFAGAAAPADWPESSFRSASRLRACMRRGCMDMLRSFFLAGLLCCGCCDR